MSIGFCGVLNMCFFSKAWQMHGKCTAIAWHGCGKALFKRVTTQLSISCTTQSSIIEKRYYTMMTGEGFLLDYGSGLVCEVGVWKWEAGVWIMFGLMIWEGWRGLDFIKKCHIVLASNEYVAENIC